MRGSRTRRNHMGARDHTKEVQDYLEEEIRRGAVIGPFESNPFKVPIQISPLNTREKKGSEERRIILDLSCPDGASVNDGIPDNQYLGEACNLTYPTIDDFIRLINQVGGVSCTSTVSYPWG